MLDALRLIAWTSVAEPLTTFSLIFGGCCSNALTLELITSQYPPAGSLITFAQFLLVALVGLRKQLIILPKRVPRADALKHVIAELDKAKGVNNVTVYGPDVHATHAFTRDLATLANGTLSEDPDVAKTINGVGGEPSPKSDMPVVSSILLSGSSGSPLIPFKIVLQKSYSLDQTAAVVLDISDSERIAVLRPCASRFTLNPFRIRFKPCRIPLSRYAIQVLLFLLISLLNNAAFAYHVPMAVHIIFRSGGLVVNMLMGWLLEKRRYTNIQIGSVLLVTAGVALTTLSSTQSKPRAPRKAWSASVGALAETEPASYGTYAIGIAILTLALLLAGLLGPRAGQDLRALRARALGGGALLPACARPTALRVHLAGPRRAGPRSQHRPAARARLAHPRSACLRALGRATPSAPLRPPLPYLPVRLPTLRVPAFYIPLLLNVLTQCVCVSGVNRLTSRVNSLTVALVLVVRKAVSLAISVLLFGGSSGSVFLWIGAAAVLAGTIGYTLGNRPAPRKKEE
ncbi:UAA-domain-containing protein [Phellopilus nigrolimitatus]|nr:UAA-domain-containing protein [Phellopilus nigrolimitatus]